MHQNKQVRPALFVVHQTTQDRFCLLLFDDGAEREHMPHLSDEEAVVEEVLITYV